LDCILFTKFFSGLKLSDVHNGLRAFSRAAAEEIRLTHDGMAHASEIVEQIKLKDLKYKEVPVTISYHEFGQGFISGLKILKDLLFGKINK